MRAVLKSSAGPGLEYRTDVAEPTVERGQVLIDVAAASLCGTDRELAEWSAAAQAFAPAIPVVVGHEGAGTVTEVGPGVEGLAVGDRVALESHLACGRCFPCRTGSAHVCPSTTILGIHFPGVFAERVAVPAGICVPVPDAVDWETAALLEATGVGVHAVDRAGVSLAGTAVVVGGAGPIGLVIAHLALLSGAAHVVVVEPGAARRARAEALGAVAVEPGADLRAASGVGVARGGFDVAFDASGAPGALEALLAALRPEAVAVTVGHPGHPVPVDVAGRVNKWGITLRGIFGRRLWDTWEQTLRLVDSGRLDLSWLVSHRMGLSEIDAALELLSGDSAKVVLSPGR